MAAISGVAALARGLLDWLFPSRAAGGRATTAPGDDADAADASRMTGDKDGRGKEPRMLLWCVSIDDAALVDPEQMAWLLDQLSCEERARATRFRFADDQRRALVSALLQRALVRRRFGLSDDDDFELRR